MPLPMVHFAVAKELLPEGFDKSQQAEYYLGAIAPDGIHMRGNPSPDAKPVSHLRVLEDGSTLEPTSPVWRKRILSFVPDKTASDYALKLGYVVHLLTDYCWTDGFYHAFYTARYAKDAAPTKNERMAYYNDTDLLDDELYRQSWREEIWKLLPMAQGADFSPLCSREEMLLWRDRTLIWFDKLDLSGYDEQKYIFMEDLDVFCKNAADAITRDLKSLDIS